MSLFSGTKNDSIASFTTIGLSGIYLLQVTDSCPLLSDTDILCESMTV